MILDQNAGAHIVIPTVGSLRQKADELKASLNYTVGPCLNKYIKTHDCCLEKGPGECKPAKHLLEQFLWKEAASCETEASGVG